MITTATVEEDTALICCPFRAGIDCVITWSNVDDHMFFTGEKVVSGRIVFPAGYQMQTLKGVREFPCTMQQIWLCERNQTVDGMLVFPVKYLRPFDDPYLDHPERYKDLKFINS